jgi:hypothetical protein
MQILQFMYSFYFLALCEPPEDGDNAETCSSYGIERVNKLWNCAFVGAAKVLMREKNLCICTFLVLHIWTGGK